MTAAGRPHTVMARQHQTQRQIKDALKIRLYGLDQCCANLGQHFLLGEDPTSDNGTHEFDNYIERLSPDRRRHSLPQSRDG